MNGRWGENQETSREGFWIWRDMAGFFVSVDDRDVVFGDSQKKRVNCAILRLARGHGFKMGIGAEGVDLDGRDHAGFGKLGGAG